jgi:hypothetical protein
VYISPRSDGAGYGVRGRIWGCLTFARFLGTWGGCGVRKGKGVWFLGRMSLGA